MRAPKATWALPGWVLLAVLASGVARGGDPNGTPGPATDWLPLRDGARWVYGITSSSETWIGDAAPQREESRSIRVDGIELLDPAAQKYKWGVYREIGEDGSLLTDANVYASLLLVPQGGDLLEVGRYWDGGTAYIPEPEETFAQPLVRLRAGAAGPPWPYEREDIGYREKLSADVLGFETVETPAGRFEGCLVVRFSGKGSGAGSAGGEHAQFQPSEVGWTEWYAAGVGKVKKHELHDLRGRTSKGRPVRIRRETTMLLREFWPSPPPHPAPPPSEHKGSDRTHTTAREIYSLLEAGRFAEVDARFAAIQAEYRSGGWKSGDVEHLLGHMADRAELDAWLRARPDSWAAHLARGKGLVREGWRRRGQGFVADSSASQLDGMRAAFDAAAKELARAIELEPAAPASFSVLMEIARAAGSAEQSRALFERLLEVETNPARAYEEYMWSLEPRWGGSLEAMNALVSEAARRHGKPVADAVQAKYHMTLGDLAWQHARRAEAETQYDRSLALAPNDAVLAARGRLRASLGRFKDALADIDLLFERSGQRKDVVVERAKMRQKLGWYEQARADLAHVAAQSPDDTEALAALAEVELRQRRFDDAASRWARITELNGDHAGTWYNRGEFLAKRLGRHADAAKAYRRAVELAEAHPRAWYEYGMALHRSRDREAPKVLAHFLELAGARHDYRKEVVEVRGILGPPPAARER
jgi:tetratricopeptide (TPR) repeat protein